MTDVDVAIIGAGISGLSVAHKLQSNGRTVRIFEARDRSGGRMLSPEVPGGHADLGPTWFWPNEPRIRSLVSEFDLAVHGQFADGDALFAVGGQVHRVNSFQAAPAFRFSNGAQSLSDALTDRLPVDTILYSTPVTRVERASNHLKIHCGDETTTAATAVLALPPSLVMSAGIVDATDLDPTVAQTASQTPVWMGAITKAVAVYDRPFWREQGLSGMISEPGGTFGEIHDMSGAGGSPAMLFGFSHDSGNGAATAEDLRQQLVSILGEEASNPAALLDCAWPQEPFTTPAAGNDSQRYDLYGSPLLRTPSWDNRLHWASTETGAVAPGHLEGALEAAERTVESILL